MLKIFRKRTLSFLLCFIMLFGMTGANSLSAVAEEKSEAPVEVFSKNILSGEKYRLMFAIAKADVPEGAELAVEVTKDGMLVETVLDEDVTTVKGKDAYVYAVKMGVAAQNIADEYVITVKIDGKASSTTSYSVLEYLFERLYVSDSSAVSEVQRELYRRFIAYADYADIVYNQKTLENSITVSDYVFVSCENLTFNGGKTEGVYPSGTTLTDFATEISSATYIATNLDTGEIKTIDTENGFTLDGNYKIEAIEKREASLAVFSFGANGSSAHKDGSTDKSTYSEASNGYTLSITGGAKFYPSSYDANGNSCIKLGSTSSSGKFTFTVADNVTKVIIRIAGYKTATAKLSINGGASRTVSTLSNNGEYTDVIIDTTDTKTVSFTTQSGGYRAMMDSIEFIGYANQ